MASGKVYPTPTNLKPNTPAIPGSVLQPVEADFKEEPPNMGNYQKDVGKVLHLMQWLRPDILNATREVS